MFNFKKMKKVKMTLQELEEIKKRNEMINEHILVINLLQGSFAGYRKAIEEKYKLDATHNWNIDLLTGEFKDAGLIEQPKEEIKK